MIEYVKERPPSQNWGLQRASNWQLRFCWLPKRCYLTGKKLWCCRAYRGENWVTGPGEPLMLLYWIEKQNSSFGI